MCTGHVGVGHPEVNVCVHDVLEEEQAACRWLAEQEDAGPLLAPDREWQAVAAPEVHDPGLDQCWA